MKLARIGERGFERPAVVDSEGRRFDISEWVPDVNGVFLATDWLSQLRALDLSKCPVLDKDARVGAPVADVGKIVCVGLNYSDHAAESGMAIPGEPILFLKGRHTIQGPDDDVLLPPGSLKSDWEVELGVVIGRRAAYVPLERALDHVAGYCVFNDLSERHFQLERGGQWDKGKNCETFGPLGPWLVPREQIPDVQDLSLWLDVNGHRYQRGSTRTMVFPVDFLVHYISQFMPLEPGDVISTGTPPGVGLGQKPPVYLRAGDTIELGIDYLGTQRQRVVGHDINAAR